MALALQYFTGNKEHNVASRMRAVKMGLTLNEYGLARVDQRTDGGERAPRKRSTRPWDSTGFRRSCARMRAKSRPRRRTSSRSW